LRVEVRIERFVDRFDVLQPRAEFHVEAVGDHLKKLVQQLPFQGRKPRVCQHPLLQGRRLDRQEMLPPVEELQAAPGSQVSKHDPGHYRRCGGNREHGPAPDPTNGV
jgi:hypothetical protein